MAFAGVGELGVDFVVDDDDIGIFEDLGDGSVICHGHEPQAEELVAIGEGLGGCGNGGIVHLDAAHHVILFRKGAEIAVALAGVALQADLGKDGAGVIGPLSYDGRGQAPHDAGLSGGILQGQQLDALRLGDMLSGIGLFKNFQNFSIHNHSPFIRR